MSGVPLHMLQSLVDGIAVVVHDAQPPGDAEWAAWMATYRAHASEMRAIVVYSLGGGPNGRQRSELTTFLQGLEQTPPTYIVTSSVVMRGIVTAVRWFLPANRVVKTFALDDLARVFDDLDLAPALRAAITGTIDALRRELDERNDVRRAG